MALLFSVALLFAATSGQNFKIGHRVSIVYAYCLLATLFEAIDFPVAVMGSIVVLFLVLEVFNADDDRIAMFSVVQKLIDFVYRLMFELYVLFYFVLLGAQCWALSTFKGEAGVYWAAIAAILVLIAFTSRMSFSTLSISEIRSRLKQYGKDPELIIFSSEDRKKLRILVFMEDGSFYSRPQGQHILSIGQAISGLRRKIRSTPSFTKNLRKRIIQFVKTYFRGYGTIEMQILRNVGLRFGSYQHTFRRKMFELCYAQLYFNAYINQLPFGSSESNKIKDWIINVYLNMAPVKVGMVACKSADGSKSTFQQLFGKNFSDLSCEEFFVWCLGLPHYEMGVGKNAIAIHMDAVRIFNLDKVEIERVIAAVRKRVDPAC